jgi:prepilin-type N-terminal cleavage/methylation domain-containing protein
MNHQRATQRGFTLSEILVAIAVFTIIFIAALLLYDRANKVFKSSMQAGDVQQNTRVAFERLVSELRMAGFDFDRDGYPTGSQKYQQPDEQLEYVHRRAITFRSNLDYESDAAGDNGRETAYEPGFATAATTDDYFPIVTTGNSEIITYFLRSENSAANDDSISFIADTFKPRKTFPVTGVGANEATVTISNVDLCQNSSGVDTGCMSPPYTLYRVTLKEDGTVDSPVPVAENIRSIDFTYFRDTRGTVTVTPNGGIGQYIVTGGSTTAASLAAREVRAQIRAVHLRLTGMAESADTSYQDPIEVALTDSQEVASARVRRQYQLESMIVPRNLGKRGLQEIDVKAPGAPDITTVCTVGCGVVKVKWNAPDVGTVTAYTVVFDTSLTGAFNSTPTDAGRNLYAYVSGLTPGTAYYFRVIAENQHGSRFSDPFGPVVPINRTRPEAPTNMAASGGTATGSPAAVENVINLTWRAPQNNITYNSAAPFNSCGESEDTIGSQAENNGIIIKRSTIAAFDPDTQGDVIFSGLHAAAGGPAVDEVGNSTYADTSAHLQCTLYYYAVRTYENGCHTDASRNSAGNVEQALSPWSPVISGLSTSSVSPAAPTVIATTPASSCAAATCSITLRWDEVTTDSGGAAIQVSQYTLRRQTYTGGTLVAGSEQTFPVTDSTLGDGGVTYTDTTAPQPAAGTIYHYDVAARHCTAAPSAYSTAVARFPCAQLNVSYTGTFIDGTGTATDPWLVTSGSATIGVTSDTNLTSATATRRVYPGGTTTTNLGSGLTANPRVAAFSVDLVGMGDTFEITITAVDVNGCSTTVRVYAQEAPAACCLRPYKDAVGTIFDTTVQTVTLGGNNNDPATINVAIKNDCDDLLTIEEIRMAWTGSGTTGSSNNLVSIKYPGLAVATATPDLDGTIVITPSSVAGANTTVPAATSTAAGVYDLLLTFSRSGSTTVNSITSFCVRYRRPDGTSSEDCRIIQEAGTSCP